MPPRRHAVHALATACALALAGLDAAAQAAPANAESAAGTGWQACAALDSDAPARLACYDQWAATQGSAREAAPGEGPALPPASAADAVSAPPALASNQPVPATAPVPEAPVAARAQVPGCRDPQYSTLSRFWELERAASCPSLSIRGYRPIGLSLIASNRVATQPTSPNPLNNPDAAQPYRTTETRMQLSVRTKLMRSIFTQSQEEASDSLWYGYTQQSYWQLFTAGLSRPFRNTDHEPELIYVYPTQAALPGGWQLRYSGVGLVHQSNGQTLPLSRSWNRIYLMGGMEHGKDLRITGRIWHRFSEEPATDDNPDISTHVGRAEISASWNLSPVDTLGATVRHSLESRARGSVRIEWLRTIGEADSGLRFHTQLFSGYGDSLLDYNRRRTVLAVGLSLVDF